MKAGGGNRKKKKLNRHIFIRKYIAVVFTHFIKHKEISPFCCEKAVFLSDQLNQSHVNKYLESYQIHSSPNHNKTIFDEVNFLYVLSYLNSNANE